MWDELRIVDEEENGNDSEHVNTIRVRLEWGKIKHKCPQDKFTSPTNRRTAHERAVKGGNLAASYLGRKKYSPMTYQCDFEPDSRFEPQVCIFRYASQEWIRKNTSFLPRSKSQSSTLSPAPAHPQHHPGLDDSLVEGFDIPSNSPNQSERGLGPLQRGLDRRPIAIPIKPTTDIAIHATPNEFNKADIPGSKSPGNQKAYPPRAPSKPKLEEDRKDTMSKLPNMVQGNNGVLDEPAVTSNKSKSEGCSDDEIVVIYHKKAKDKRKRKDNLEEGGVKKRLKSEEDTGPPQMARALSKGKEHRSDNVELKVETTD